VVGGGGGRGVGAGKHLQLDERAKTRSRDPALIGGAAVVVREQTGVVLDPWQPDWVWLWAPAALVGLGALAGIGPAWKAYTVDVAASLAPES
jgi:hypothetical protein